MRRKRNSLLKNFKNRLKRLKNKYPDRRIQVWFQDETRVGQQGCLTRQWGLTGQRLTVPKQLEYQSVYGIGAVCPETGDAVALVGPTADTWVMNEFLQELSTHVAQDIQVVMVMDGAAWHRSKGLKEFPNITPIILPPYSPELNPIERVWGYLKSHYLANHIFEDYETILDEVCHAWNHFRSDIERVKSLTSESWFLFQT